MVFALVEIQIAPISVIFSSLAGYYPAIKRHFKITGNSFGPDELVIDHECSHFLT